MAEPETARTAEQQIKDAVWQYTGQAVLLLAVLLTGLAIGWLLWGDAATVRAQLKDAEQKIHAARAERETLQHQRNQAQQQTERCNRELSQLKASAPALAPAQ